MELDANQIIQKLSARVAQLTVELVIAEATIEALSEDEGPVPSDEDPRSV